MNYDARGDLAPRLKAAEGKPSEERREEVLRALAETLSQAFTLNSDEMAILLLSPDRVMLRFVFPPELAKGGSNTFPVSLPSVAGRVASTGESCRVNDMQEIHRLAFYERIPMRGAEPTEIHKLLAVAVPGAGGVPQAVIEVSRRGSSPAESGPDFSPADQELLEGVATAAANAIASAFTGDVPTI